MLSDDEKQKIEDEERLRRELRELLDPKKEEKPFWKTAFAGDNIKWLATTILIPLVAFGTSFWLQHTAERGAEGRQDVSQLTALLPALASTDQTQRCMSLAVLRELGSIAKPGSAIKDTYETISGETLDDRSSPSLAVKTQAAKSAACLAPPGKAQSGGAQLPPSAPVPAVVPAAPPRKDELVYLQIYHNEQLPDAQALVSALQAAGVPVATAIDNVGADHGAGVISYAQSGTIDVRYYYKDDLPLAVSVAKIVQQTAHVAPTLRDLSDRGNKARQGVLEVWYPCAPAGVKCVIG